ncbi:MAG: MOSC domain-containing protein, partial [Candidatus Omnitrophota bacterium]
MKKGTVFSINCSKIKGVSKLPVDKALLIKGFGLKEDVHAGNELRQVSLLAIESIRRQKECAKIKENDSALKAGDFAENITTEGIDLASLKINDKLKIGSNAVLEISK